MATTAERLEDVLNGAGWDPSAESADAFVARILGERGAAIARHEMLREAVLQSSVEFRDKVIYMADADESNPDHQNWLVSLYVPVLMNGNIGGSWPGGSLKGPVMELPAALDQWIDRMVAERKSAGLLLSEL